MVKYRWDQVPVEQMNPSFARQVLHGHHMTIARLHLTKGSVVPTHHHVNEQVTLLLTGRLRFIFPEKEEVIGAGEVMEIAPNLPHQVIALEDSTAFDLFSPIREDWIRGEDAYLRQT